MAGSGWTRRRSDTRDAPLYAIVAAFVAWELFAEYVARNRAEHTLSNRIHALEHRHPLTRLLVAGVMGALTLHLLQQDPPPAP